MCGIVGFWNLDNRPAAKNEVWAMAQMIAHRGPDGYGEYVEGAVGLGHRRLAILDLSPSGKQPMSYADGRYWITFNGEIYNFIELREELAALGYTFQSTSDTEVILAAYDRWGADCQLRFNGMWAFAIWDKREQLLFLSRDRFGVKPLHYYFDGKHFAFGSEMKAFLPLPWFDLKFDPQTITDSIGAFTSIEGTEDCMLKGLRRLRGGWSLTLKRGQEPKLDRWWNTLHHIHSVPENFLEQAEMFRDLFLDACRIRMRSDVSVGTALSGGLDSSSVLCGMAYVRKHMPDGGRLAADWQRSFVACHPGTGQDERHYAEEVVRHINGQAVYLEIDPADCAKHLDELIFSFEELADHPPIGAWLTYREMRKHGVVVSLNGHGGDELLCGYNYYLPTAIKDAELFPSAGMQARVNDLRLTEMLMDRRREYPVDENAPTQRTLPGDRGHWYRQAGRGENFQEYIGEMSTLSGFDALSRVLYYDFHYRTLPTILRNFDRLSMAHGVEIRAPFLDYRLACLCFSLPAFSKVGQGFSKLILRQALDGILPKKIQLRTSKLGFVSPFVDWINDSVKPVILDTIHCTNFLQSDIWNGPAIRDYILSSYGQQAHAGIFQCWPFLHAFKLTELFAEQQRLSRATLSERNDLNLSSSEVSTSCSSPNA